MTKLEENLEAVRVIANNLGYDLIKMPSKAVSLTLGKNRKESGHTVRYSQLDHIFRELGKTSRCREGRVVTIKTSNGDTASFNLNSGERAYCGTKNGAYLFDNRSSIGIVDIMLN